MNTELMPADKGKTDEEVLSFNFDLSSLPEKYRDKNMLITMWEKDDGDMVKKDDLLFETKFIGPQGVFDLGSVKAAFDGILEIIKQSSTDLLHPDYLKDGETTFKIHIAPSNEKIIELKKKRFHNVPLIIKDDFTGSKEIKWDKVAGQHPTRFFSTGLYDCIKLNSNNPKLKNLFFTINNIDNKDFIVFRYPTRDFKITVGSIISFLFDDNEILQFEIVNKPFKHSNNSNWGDIFETKIQLTLEELNSLINKELKSWKIDFDQNKSKIIGIIDSEDISYPIKKLAKDYCDLVKSELTDYKPLQNRPINIDAESKSDECYVYLMIDLTNNYHKIGISTNPDIREKTLQSEKPTIELIISKQFPNRKIAKNFEQVLHQAYTKKRIRGEWFQLTERDIQEIKNVLN